ncbi:glycosyltransferase family 4 protein [Paenibacillus thalictri]|uniref:Glycosyltransferase n=1 Tax=Paenibacillus thalictri TaxID=2527873 RepID=A0A4Q9DFR1_9BACL|nr:glycosyltransferase family 4 protein [Paenibacillus thalictri]TBL70844.1 glycosyltransferase [Paenibacillus thalictri]
MRKVRSKPKVCIMTSVHQPYDIRIFYKQARSLAAAGYDVNLIAQKQENTEEEVDGVRFIPVPKSKNRVERISKTVWQVFSKAVKQKADIYHFHDPELLPAGIMLKLLGKKVIYDIHENVAEQIQNKQWVPCRRLISRMYRLLELTVCRLFPLVLAEASYDKLYPASWKKTVVQNFAELALFPERSSVAKQANSLVYIGGVTRLRGISVVLEALHLLKQQRIDFHFDCIGPAAGEYRNELERQCADYGLTKQVTFHGHMKAAEAYRIVQKSSIGLAVLQPDPNYFESFPTKMFEYMALRIPFITSNFPLYVKTVEATGSGVAVDPQNPAMLAQTIRYMLEHPMELKEMGEKGRAAVEATYNWSREESKLLQLYDDLLAGSVKSVNKVNKIKNLEESR